ncbi:MAG: AAA family ATPase [Sediminibacterium sp.]|nr:AAA family ATPase [Sediminibacterium sp.]
MITEIKIKNFKTLGETDWMPLNGNVVFIGPNNSGKTSALQALALWNYGVQKWLAKKNIINPEIRLPAIINRKDLFAIPISESKFIWTNLFTRKSEKDKYGKITSTKDVNIEIIIKGNNTNKEWIFGLQFRYDSEETIYVKPMEAENKLVNDDFEFLQNINVAFLPPMSGLKLEEEKLLFSTVEYRMGEGRTAEVLGNLCYQVIYPENAMISKDRNPEDDWNFITSELKKLFLIDLQKPELDQKGIIKMKYLDAKGNEFELMSSGRGMHQIILLLAYLLIKPNSIILLDEPDAHLEILKQEQVYELISNVARKKKSQLIMASHSEVVLRKAVASEDNVIAFYPQAHPKLLNEKSDNLLKSLKTIGFEEYYLAQQFGWILYLEGGTDLPILKKFAKKLHHPILPKLENCFHKTINTNDPKEARKHFSGLKDAHPNLIGIALYDNIQNQIGDIIDLNEIKWHKNEIENYFFKQQVLIDWAKGEVKQDLFGQKEAEKRMEAMNQALDDVLPGAAKRNVADSYWSDSKASIEIEKILKAFYKYVGYPGNSSKANFVDLIDYLAVEDIDKEIIEKLDFINKMIPII